jgi:endonuclease III
MVKIAANPNAAQNQDLLKVISALEERYGQRKSGKFTDFIEALVFQILELGAQEKSARDALKRLRDEYVDWNDMRVATVRELEDILGSKYVQVRKKAEDIKHLLADLYTAFRRMEIGELPPEGVETLRALPETTNVRKDDLERALVLTMDFKVFPCDEDQFKLLKFLGGVPKQLTMQQGVKKVEESLDAEQMIALSRGLREHVHFCHEAGEDEPQMIAFNWDKKDPLGMDKGMEKEQKKAAEKPAAKAPAKKKK